MVVNDHLNEKEPLVAKIVVEVMPKPALLDPEGKAIGGAIERLGFDTLANIRVGKRFEITVDGVITEEMLMDAKSVAEQLLANPAIEDVVSVTPVEA